MPGENPKSGGIHDLKMDVFIIQKDIVKVVIVECDQINLNVCRIS